MRRRNRWISRARSKDKGSISLAQLGTVGGLFSADFAEAPWSLAKAWDLTKHLPIPAIVLGVSGTAQMIRIMRSNLLDELRKPYVMTARARGLSEYRVIMKYPVRVALNPFVSTIGYLLPYVVSGSIIVSLVLSLPTVGPLLLKALIAQDMFLAHKFFKRARQNIYSKRKSFFYNFFIGLK